MKTTALIVAACLLYPLTKTAAQSSDPFAAFRKGPKSDLSQLFDWSLRVDKDAITDVLTYRLHGSAGIDFKYTEGRLSCEVFLYVKPIGMNWLQEKTYRYPKKQWTTHRFDNLAPETHKWKHARGSTYRPPCSAEEFLMTLLNHNTLVLRANPKRSDCHVDLSGLRKAAQPMIDQMERDKRRDPTSHLPDKKIQHSPDIDAMTQQEVVDWAVSKNNNAPTESVSDGVKYLRMSGNNACLNYHYELTDLEVDDIDILKFRQVQHYDLVKPILT